MYTKEELEQMEIPQLMDVASQLGVKVSPSDSRETVIYDILDKAAIDSAASEASPKRKRTRIDKKDSDHVYSAAGQDGENKDGGSAKKTRGRKRAETAQPSAAEAKPEVPAESAPAASAQVALPEKPAKHRGRKSKAELAAIAAAEAEKARLEQMANAREEAAEAGEETIPEASEPVEAAPDQPSTDQLEQLQEHYAAPKTDEEGGQKADDNDDDVWSGDPGDGTDFITIVDLPIEDQAAMPTLDIFDRPVSPQQSVEPVAYHAPQQQPANNGRYDFADLITANGVLEIMQDGYGFLRSSDYNYLSSPDDVYVSNQQIKKYSLKTGDVVECVVRPPHEGEKFFAMGEVSSINGRHPSEVRDRVSFEHLTPLVPEEKFNLTGTPQTTNPSTRIVDLFAPIGKGQRALIVAQPKTGKTILMKDIANAIASNHPEAYIMMLLIDERPEEVTDMARTVNAEVIASTFDEPAERHVKIAGIVLEKAKRMVECGHDVVIFLDSITRLARAYNTVAPASGKVLTGGVDANALQKPKRFFGAARKIEGGGSLTIIATALVDTGSKMDEVIFEEFKGTGNSEIQLDRMLSNKRIFPAMNLVQSSTRRDDLLQDQTTLNRMWIIRKFIAEMTAVEAMNTVYDRLVQSKNNEEFLMSMNG
ncbi:MAG: transcription termination factor Rho [Prevotella sp.]|nr:transcription termination factor Rho [Prevotella sp.]